MNGRKRRRGSTDDGSDPDSRLRHEVDRLVASDAAGRFDAELHGWWRHRINGFLVLVGAVFGDRRGRWPDGRMISTSVLVSKNPQEGAIVKTMNSRYLLIGPENLEARQLMPESSTTGWDAVLGRAHQILLKKRLNESVRGQIESLGKPDPDERIH